jgi:hypothetical protein
LGLQTAVVSPTFAKRIIALAKAAGRNPDLLCEGVLKELRDQRL